MPANVETMFYVREKPWHGLGTEVQEAPTSADALVCAGMDWFVEQKNVYAEDGSLIPGYKVNTRSTDNAALGIVSDRYKVVQNEDAFQFTDDLLGAGVTYETAGALQGGRKVWMLARMPHRYIIAGDEIAPYLVVMNSHDGSSGIKVAMTPIRVVCQNTLNLALDSAKRIWTTKHTENVMSRVHEAEETLGLAEKYMGELGRGIDALSRIKLTDKKVMEFMNEFFPVTLDLPDVQRKGYPLLSRTYCFNSDNKAFWPNMGGYSIFAYCLDKTSDQGVWLDWCMAEEGNPGGWKVEDCYILEQMRDVAAIPHLTRTEQGDGTVCYFFGDTCIRVRETHEEDMIHLEPAAGDQAACGEWVDLPVDRVHGYCTLLERHLNRREEG